MTTGAQPTAGSQVPGWQPGQRPHLLLLLGRSELVLLQQLLPGQRGLLTAEMPLQPPARVCRPLLLQVLCLHLLLPLEELGEVPGPVHELVHPVQEMQAQGPCGWGLRRPQGGLGFPWTRALTMWAALHPAATPPARCPPVPPWAPPSIHIFPPPASPLYSPVCPGTIPLSTCLSTTLPPTAMLLGQEQGLPRSWFGAGVGGAAGGAPGRDRGGSDPEACHAGPLPPEPAPPERHPP